MNLIYKKATLKDLDILIETRIEVLLFGKLNAAFSVRLKRVFRST